MKFFGSLCFEINFSTYIDLFSRMSLRAFPDACTLEILSLITLIKK